MQAMSEPNGLFNTWILYDRILDHNYMFHEELYQDVRDFIAHHYAGNSFTLLDLGCGSARHMATALEGSAISHYTGYDLSSIALMHARSSLKVLHCSVDLRQKDLLEGIIENHVPFDIIFSSFALHHLTSEEKQVFFQSAYQKLKTGGIFLLIDVTREEDESRAVYLQRYCDWLKREWHGIPVTGLNMISEHICDQDFPETMNALRVMAENAGFQTATEIAHYRWHRCIGFEKNKR